MKPPRGPCDNASACADCHSPRDLRTGKYFLDRLFAGSTIAFGGAMEGLPAAAYAPNITFDRETGIGGWTEEQFVEAMRTGARPDGTVMLTLMPWPYYSFWTASDLVALYRYLKAVPVQKNRVPPVAFSKEITANSGTIRGEVLFNAYCAACHGERGKGAAPTTVPLAQISSTLEDGALREFIAQGVPGSRMPAFRKTFTPEQLSDMVAFIRSWK